ncbi:tellurite resistance TerB family protein [Paenibacillus harenae]|uniref:Tellurite resistance protein TerB n=1 Tax=Paenibacillus harenae TaxID=306543 RepID=A0ABT9TZ80_PAEHA|nr:tellurite resistance TerB family protein [Paenibacillus harenae]MDQ0059216.1 tellurite resistance protein TerB [Paenibacillus harenae]MDQ0112680.1 tellurite resistance protein TerB [Paenibacillus harenae]
MSTFKSWLQSSKQGLTDQVKKFKNKDFLDAVVAGCAIVAGADGSIDSAEKQKMSGYISRSEELKVFDMGDVINRFNHFASNIEFDGMIGKQEALKAIGKFRGKPDVARVIVGVCSAIGAADGNFDPHEKAAVADICNALGLNPSEFNL